jgi:hypothetical protein
MAGKSDTQLREELRTERAALADAVGDLRGAVGRAADLGSKVRAKLPLVAASAFGLGFLKAGGIGATMRFVMRRGRDGHVKGKAGRFRLVGRR